MVRLHLKVTRRDQRTVGEAGFQRSPRNEAIGKPVTGRNSLRQGR